MANARYIFRECVPDGSIDIANELQGISLTELGLFG